MEHNLENSTLSNTIDLNSNPNIETHQGDEHELIQELSRMRSENRKLTDLLTIVSRNFSEIKQMQLVELSRTRKRKADDDDDDNFRSNPSINTVCSGDHAMPNVIRSNISRVYVRIDPSDDSLVVKDGYQWRKYGQKVTRDNPWPRAYYKCSLAPSCPAKKKVQRSVDDPSLLVATYEGHHHHGCRPRPPDSDNSTVSPRGGRAPSPAQYACISGDCNNTQSAVETSESNEIEQFLVEKMASSLTKNSGFTAALAAAITGRLMDEVISTDHNNIL